MRSSFSMLLGVVTRFLFVNVVSSAIVDPATFAKTSFDFIVAGGGTAGVVVAVRLSEIANFTVGLIEAGDFKPGDPRILIPQGWNSGKTWGNPNYDWNFFTTPQKNLDNRELRIIRGKVLGGSSALNLMVTFLAGAIEYDQIGQLGNPGWSYNSTLHYFKKATNMSVAPKTLQVQTHATFSPQYHGTSGPIRLSFSSWFSRAIPLFFRAMVNFGLAPVYDGSNGLDEGSVWNPPLAINQDTETRSYSAVEYYAPNANRPNLHVVTGAQVIKIELSSTLDRSGNLRATGVTYVSGGQTYTANVSKDVIVSGGSIQSPQILELSGIGNKTLLESVGIQSKVDLPGVGENYQDHFAIFEDFIIPPSIETWDVLNNPVPNVTAFAQYENDRSGPYTSSINAISYASAARITASVTKNVTLLAQWLAELDQQFNASNPSAGRRRMYQIERARLLPESSETSIEIYSVPSNAYPQYFQQNTSYIQLVSIPSHPFSRGSIHVNSSNPFAYPAIDLNAWSFDIDKHLCMLSAKYGRLVANTEPLSGIIKSYGFPGVNVTTDAQWEQFATENVRAQFHPCCTNSMLPQEDGGVVNSRLKVYGTANIRVADVSITPLQLSTHPSSTAYAVAEQAADMIKADYGY